MIPINYIKNKKQKFNYPNSPLISIITVVYNRRKYLEKTMESEMSANVIDFGEYYIITPNIDFKFKKNKYLKNKEGKTGKFVENGFEYASSTNKKFLNIKEIKKLNDTNSINDSV